MIVQPVCPEQTEKETKQGTGKQDTGAKQDTTGELEKIKNKVRSLGLDKILICV